MRTGTVSLVMPAKLALAHRPTKAASEAEVLKIPPCGPVHGNSVPKSYTD